MQKSAEGIVDRGSRSTRSRHSPERGETVGIAGPGTTWRRPKRYPSRREDKWEASRDRDS